MEENKTKKKTTTKRKKPALTEEQKKARAKRLRKKREAKAKQENLNKELERKKLEEEMELNETNTIEEEFEWVESNGVGKINTTNINPIFEGENAEKKQTPNIGSVGSSPNNPIDMSGGSNSIYNLLETIYGDVGYFILSEQVLPIKTSTIKLVQLKLDNGEYKNLFIKV